MAGVLVILAHLLISACRASWITRFATSRALFPALRPRHDDFVADIVEDFTAISSTESVSKRNVQSRKS